MIDLRKKHGYLFLQKDNTNQTLVYFEMQLDATLKKTGSKLVSPLMGGNMKLRCTVMLCILADGTKLRPYLVLKCKTLLKTMFLPRMIISMETWMTSDWVIDWLKTLWETRPGMTLAQRLMLLLDLLRGHSTDVKARLSGNRMDLVTILGGMTLMLQPLDECLKKKFKAHVEWMYTK